MPKKIVGFLTGVLALALIGCATPGGQPPGPYAGAPIDAYLTVTETKEEGRRDWFVTPDGAALGLQVWEAEGTPAAVVVGLHGMNDYANAFDMPGSWWAARGITTYAMDQRGFGRSPHPGLWPGTDRMVADTAALVDLVASRHPDTPLYLVGLSMGGAVAMAYAAEARETTLDGVVLVAPGVWGWSSLNPLYKSVLWLTAHLAPRWSFTGSGLGIRPSDNIEMLRAFSADPLVIKETRTDAIYGVVSLMERAAGAAPQIDLPVLFLYGEKDEIIPPGPTREAIGALCPEADVALYPDGWHMLLRDLQAEIVWRDVMAWMTGGGGDLPSGHGADGCARALSALGD